MAQFDDDVFVHFSFEDTFTTGPVCEDDVSMIGVARNYPLIVCARAGDETGNSHPVAVQLGVVNQLSHAFILALWLSSSKPSVR